MYSTAPTSKYAPLQMHLSGVPHSESYLQLSFAEIEQIIGDRLPPSAANHREWWSNHAGSHVQARAWLEAGWEADSVDRGAQMVRFRRLTSNGRPAAVIAGVGENDMEETVAAVRRARAQAAVSRLRRTAAERGVDKLSAAEIESEIVQSRAGGRR